MQGKRRPGQNLASSVLPILPWTKKEYELGETVSLSDPSVFTGSRRPKHYRSDHTQTSQNPTILYYHERKKSSLDDTTPLLDEEEEEEEEEDTPDHLEDRVTNRWFLS